MVECPECGNEVPESEMIWEVAEERTPAMCIACYELTKIQYLSN